tara:strand:- start:22791 stop:23165 length:375 start_codon:yes stop_codon:yes gene_type:complete
MIKGIGTDLVSILRIEQVLSKHGERFAAKILGSEEYKQFHLSKRKLNFLAKRFAAKEATAKALGTGFSKGISWKDIQLAHNDHGKPELILTDGALDRFESLGAEQLLISLSDEASLIIAYVIIE